MPYEQVGKNEPVCIADEVPFDIPNSWEWARLSVVNDIYTGNSINESEKKLKYTGLTDGYYYIGTKDVGFDHSIDYDNGVRIPYGLDKFRIAPQNSILMCIEGGSAGRKISFTNQDVCFGNKLCCFVSLGIEYLFLYYYLQSPLFQIIFKENTTGIIGGVSVNTLKSLFFPIPPLEEQKRIVEKLIQLEPFLKIYAEAEGTIEKLNTSFPELLKKSILQEAVQGKLVPQDENDEPAFVLLERIRAEKQALIKAGKIKKDKNESVIFRRDNSHYEKLNGIERCIDDEIPFEIPENWCWVRLGSMIGIQRGASPRPKGSPEYWSKERTEHHWIKISDITKHSINDYLNDTDEFLTDLGSTKSVFVNSDYLITAASGSLGKIAKLNISGYIYDGLMCMCFKNTSLEKDYIIVLIKTMVEYLMSISTGTAWKNITTDILKSLLVPLPPLTEQRRIVSAYNSLLPYVEQL